MISHEIFITITFESNNELSDNNHVEPSNEINIVSSITKQFDNLSYFFVKTFW